jgi:hypothetical protein
MAIEWAVCLTAPGYICRTLTAIMTDEICAMAQCCPYLATSVAICRASGHSTGHRSGAAGQHRVPVIVPNRPFRLLSDEARFGDKI